MEDTGLGEAEWGRVPAGPTPTFRWPKVRPGLWPPSRHLSWLTRSRMERLSRWWPGREPSALSSLGSRWSVEILEPRNTP